MQAPQTTADERVETAPLTPADPLCRTGADAVVAQARVTVLEG